MLDRRNPPVDPVSQEPEGGSVPSSVIRMRPVASLMFSLLLLLFAQVSPTFSETVPEIIILDSYHHGYNWSDQEIIGFLERMREVHPLLDPPVEHLDAKRNPAEDNLIRIKTMLEKKYAGRSVDMIVALDNPALELLLRYENELFPGAPIVFGGINDFVPSLLQGRRKVTGVPEVMDCKATLDIALMLHPDAKELLVIHDYTRSGLAVRKEVEGIILQFAGRIKIRFMPEVSSEEAVEEMRRLSPDSLGLILTFTTDRLGRSMSLAESTRMLTAASRAPVYTMHETRLGHGVVGGMLIGGRSHGRQVADIALRIQAGEDPDSIPVDMSGASKPMFDYTQLERFGIPLHKLPSAGVTINKPESFVERYRTLTIGTLAVMGSLLVLALLQAISLIRLKRTQQELLKSEADYRRLVEMANEGVWSVDAEFRVVFANNRMADMLGYSVEEMIGRSVELLMFDEDVMDHRQNMEARRRGLTQTYERRYRRKDGGILWAIVSATPLKDSSGAFMGSFGMITDISERKTMEAALRKSEERFRFAMDAAEEGIWDWNVKTGEIYLSPGWVRIFNTETSDSEGAYEVWESRIHPEDREETIQRLNRHFAGEAPVFESEHRVRTDDNHWKWVLSKGRVVERDSDGSPLRAVGAIFNIHDRKTAESELKAHMVTLERLNARLSASRRISEIMLRDQELEQSLREIAQEISSTTGFSTVAIEDFDAESQEMVFRASVGIPILNEEKIRRVPADQTLSGIVARSAAPLVETAAGSRSEYAHEGLRALGVKTFVCVPMISDGHVAGCLALGRKDSVEIDEYLVEWLQSAANYVATFSEGKLRDAELKASEERFRLFMDNSPTIAWIKDQAGRLVYLSKTFESSVGINPEDWLGKTDFDLWPPDIAEESRRNDLEAMSCGHAVEVVEKRPAPDRKMRYWRNFRFSFQDASGKTYLGGAGVDITLQKNAEEKLQREKDRLKSILDHMNEAIYISNSDFDIEYMNPMLESLFGVSAGEKCYEYLHDFDKPCAWCCSADVIAGRSSQREEYSAKTQRMFEIYESPVANTDGSVSKLTVFRDITDRKQGEDALKESERRLSTLMANLPGMAYRCVNNPDWTMEFVSEGSVALTGYFPHDLVGAEAKPYVELIHPEDRRKVWAKVQEGIAEGASFELEYRIRTQSGLEKWVWERGIGTFSAKKNNIRLEGFITDISERKRTEQALKESEQRYRAVIENIQIGISVLNSKMEIVAVNKVMKDSYPHVEPGCGRICFEEYHDPPKSAPCSHCPCVLTFRDGRVHEVITETASGAATRYHRIVSSPITDELGRVEYVIELTEDITEKRSLQAQLAQAQKMEAIGTLAGGIAHDFNNLLQVVQGYSELLLGEKSAEDTEYQDLRKILQAAKSGADLVQRLLTISRKVEPKPIPMSLNRQIDHVTKLLARTIPKMIEIRLDLDPDLAEIHADPVQMEQVLMNLGVNARDAMPDGGVLTIRTGNVTLDDEYCRTHAEAKPGKYVVLSVSDTGTGMSKRVLDRIFDPFFTTKELGRGTGLGLTMVYSITKQHKGHIIVYSEIGQGAEFKIYFPALASELKSVTESIKPSLPGGTETILLADDEEHVRDLGKRILARAGYNVITAPNGKEALKTFAERLQEIRLVILDLIMPEMGGKQALDEIIRMSPQAKVLIASGYSVDGFSRGEGMIGARGFVVKPYDIPNMLRTIREILDS